MQIRFSANDHDGIFKLGNEAWYVATSHGPEGPIANREDAQRYLELLNTADAARRQMAGLEE